MGKLTKAMQAKVAKAEGGNFELLPEDIYPARLFAVDTSKNGPAGPYWVWEFKITGDVGNGRKLWVNTSLSDNALWKMKQIYEALGFTLDSDTDEMCGAECRIEVSQGVIEKGPRKGELRNEAGNILPAHGDDEDNEEGSAPLGDGDEEDPW